MARSKKKSATYVAPPAPQWPRIVEVYGDPSWAITGHSGLAATHSKPDFVNELHIERYRITVEKIDDPPIVVLQRLRGLWRTMRPNPHTWDRVWAYAQTLGLTREEAREMFSVDTQGIDRKKEH